MLRSIVATGFILAVACTPIENQQASLTTTTTIKHQIPLKKEPPAKVINEKVITEPSGRVVLRMYLDNGKIKERVLKSTTSTTTTPVANSGDNSGVSVRYNFGRGGFDITAGGLTIGGFGGEE